MVWSHYSQGQLGGATASWTPSSGTSDTMHGEAQSAGGPGVNAFADIQGDIFPYIGPAANCLISGVTDTVGTTWSEIHIQIQTDLFGIIGIWNFATDAIVPGWAPIAFVVPDTGGLAAQITIFMSVKSGGDEAAGHAVGDFTFSNA